MPGNPYSPTPLIRWIRPHARTHSLPADSSYGAVEFLSMMLPADNNVPFAASRSSAATNAVLLSPARDAVLGLPDAARLVARVCAELERTVIATPFVFSALALDVRRPAVARLVRFTEAHELRVCSRWGLSGVVRRVEGGREVRRLLSWA
ncbi:hypothetical protein C8R44DRAFT_886007 [Mycena epipterygia]|nr:hypothetical protein C8R44DRAFT_886007 [Mycena epipterygia]